MIISILQKLGLLVRSATQTHLQDQSQADTETVRRIVNELRLTHQDFVAARAAYSDKRAVIKLLKETTGEGEIS